MPRILRIMNRFNLGGPTYNAAYLTKYMSPEFETLLVGGNNEATEKNSQFILDQLEISARVIPNMQRAISPEKDRKAYLELKKIIHAFRPDIVHTHASKAGALGRIAALKAKVPVIVHTFHGHIFDSYFNRIQATMYKNIERYLARHSSGIIAISESQKTDLAEKYRICPERKIKVIPLGFDLQRFRHNQQENREFFRKKYHIDDDEIAIGIVGRLVPIKNHMMFLKAIKSLCSLTNNKIRAFIIGEGESSEFIRYSAKEMGIDYCNWPRDQRKALLTFTGWLTRMEQVNAGLDIIALTSLSEGTPVNLIEAQASGRPIVCTRVGGVENVVIPNKTAFLVEKNDYESMAHKFRLLIDNPQLLDEFSKPGWDHVKKKFHYSRLVNEMKGYYNQLLQEQHEKNNTVNAVL